MLRSEQRQRHQCLGREHWRLACWLCITRIYGSTVSKYLELENREVLSVNLRASFRFCNTCFTLRRRQRNTGLQL